MTASSTRSHGYPAVGVTQTQAEMQVILDRIRQGQPTVLTSGGRAVAAIVPMADLELMAEAIEYRMAIAAAAAPAEVVRRTRATPLPALTASPQPGTGAWRRRRA